MLRALDLFCGAGGASVGLYEAGFDVTGVDIELQPNYPFPIYRYDALEFPLEGYDLIWASPPCQRYSVSTPTDRKEDHPDLIEPIRERLNGAGVPYIIENVPTAPLRMPLELCGTMFGLKVYRHRWFETNVLIPAPPHPKHTAPVARMGYAPKEGEFMTVVGNFSGVEQAREAMGIGWMARDELAEAIPPSYSRYLAEQIIKAKGWKKEAAA